MEWSTLRVLAYGSVSINRGRHWRRGRVVAQRAVSMQSIISARQTSAIHGDVCHKCILTAKKQEIDIVSGWRRDVPA